MSDSRGIKRDPSGESSPIIKRSVSEPGSPFDPNADLDLIFGDTHKQSHSRKTEMYDFDHANGEAGDL